MPSSRMQSPYTAPRLSVGLAGMRERMNQIGGRVDVESDESGTRVRAWLPRARFSKQVQAKQS